jgi:hypothetical protein
VSASHCVTAPASGDECRFTHDGVLGASAPSGPVAPASASTSVAATATVAAAVAPLMVHGVAGVAAVPLLITVARRCECYDFRDGNCNRCVTHTVVCCFLFLCIVSVWCARVRALCTPTQHHTSNKPHTTLVVGDCSFSHAHTHSHNNKHTHTHTLTHTHTHNHTITIAVTTAASPTTPPTLTASPSPTLPAPW